MQPEVVDVAAVRVALEQAPEGRQGLAHEAQEELIGDSKGDGQEDEALDTVLEFLRGRPNEATVEEKD